jgi:chromosome segregation ATPase
MQPEILATLITAGTSLLASGWLVYVQLKRDRATLRVEKGKLDIEKERTDLSRMEIIQGSAVSLIEPMRTKIKELEDELVKLNQKLDYMEKELLDKTNKILQLEEAILCLQKQVEGLTCERDSLKLLLKDYLKY